jgi:hypothetical protein
MSKKFATIISKVFEPAILLPLAFVACSIRIGVPLITSIFWLVIMFVPMLVYRLRLKNVQKIDWDIKNRSQRGKPLFLLFIFLVIVSGFVLIFEPRLLPFLILFLIWTIGFLCITKWGTKISGHVGGDALVTGMMIRWYGWGWWPVLLIVPLVGWARVVRKDHTLTQVIAGALYSWILVVLVYWIVGNIG